MARQRHAAAALGRPRGSGGFLTTSPRHDQAWQPRPGEGAGTAVKLTDVTPLLPLSLPRPSASTSKSSSVPLARGTAGRCAFEDERQEMFSAIFFFFLFEIGSGANREARDRERRDAVGVSPRLFSRSSKIQNWVPFP
jgi:hypothetical protein